MPASPRPSGGVRVATRTRCPFCSSRRTSAEPTAIFDKIGVRSRRELIGKVFCRHFSPLSAPWRAESGGRRA